MAKDREDLIIEKRGGGRRNMERFCLIVMVLACLGLIIALIAYLASNPPDDTSDYVIVEPQYPTSAEYAINNGEKWLKDNQHTAMGWRNQQNADALLGLRLGRMSMYRPGNCDFNILSKSVEYDLLSALMRNPALDDITWGRSLLAKYIIALRAACINPKDFHGYDLMAILNTQYTTLSNFYNARRDATAMVVLAKCVSEETQMPSQVSMLQSSAAFTSVGEASLVHMALSCLNDSMYYPTIARAEDYLMSMFTNGSFGDTYMTGIAVQALTRSNRTDADDTISASLLSLAQEIQGKRNGMFRTVGEISHVLPALAKMSYVDVKGKCTELRKPQGTSTAINVTIQVNGGVINSTVDKTFLGVTIKQGQSLYDALVTLRDSNSEFTFMSVMTSYGSTLTSVMNLAVNPNSVQSWSIYLSGNPSRQSMYLDRIMPADGSVYVLRAE